MTKLANPTPLFLDGRGALLDAGYIYIGDVNTDPEIGANQLPLFWDIDMTIPAPQPLRTLGGVIVNGPNPSFVYFTSPDYSIVIRDADGNLVTSIASAMDSGGIGFQPLDSDLTAIAALATTAFGRNLLTLANQAALQSSVGVGSAGLLAKATAAEYRANTANRGVATDTAWGAAASVALANAGGTVAVDLNTGLNFTLAMTGGPWTLGDPVNGKDGQSGKIEITQDATGGRVLNYHANWDFPGGVAPVLSTGANARDVLYYCVLSNGRVHGSLNKALS